MKSKKIFFLCTLLFSSISICNAQPIISEDGNASNNLFQNSGITTKTEEVAEEVTNTESTTIKKGYFASAGINISNLSGSDADSRMAIALAFGYDFIHKSGNIYSMAVTYMRNGNQIDYDGSTLKTNLDYIGWKLDFLFKTSDKFFIGTGYSVAWSVSAKYSYGNEIMDIEDTNFHDMNIPLIARYYFRSDIFVDARYNIGLFPVVGDGFLGDGCNRSFAISLGVKF